MTREYLKSLGLDDETINKIMIEHGKSTESLKANVNTLTEENKTLQGKLKPFEEVDIEELKNQSVKHKEELRKLKLNAEIEKALLKSGAKHSDLLKGRFDMEKITEEDGKITGIDEQIESFKESYKELFEKEAKTIEGKKPANPSQPLKSNTYEDILKNADDLSTQDIVDYFNTKGE